MKHVVNSDVPGSPPQRAWQIVVGTAVDGGDVGVPLVMSRPVRLLQLMLDKELPDTCRCCDHDGRQRDPAFEHYELRGCSRTAARGHAFEQAGVSYQ